MPAQLDDPSAPARYRVSGEPPYPVPYGPLPLEIVPRQVTLRDRITIATLVPFSSPAQVPPKLMAYLCDLLGREIDKGDTYPMMHPLPLEVFAPYWFANFGAIMILGDIEQVDDVRRMEAQGVDWPKQCLGSFYISPNYPGRSSHVCNGGFLVTDAARNRGVGRLMGEGYLEWAPRLGYTYSVFNLVYETNVASLRIWDALGFKRIGRVKACGNLKSYPDQFIDAIIFGRELGGEGDEYVSEERFDKIRFYLKTGTYPNGSDRAEKSRLRSAATHYRLIPNNTGDGEEDRLMLKGKEVVSDPHKQYEIARNMHAASHGGINKTTASIAEKYHWVRIKETVSAAIRNCSECKDSAPKPASTPATKRKDPPLDDMPPRRTVRAGTPDSLGGTRSPPAQPAQQQPQQMQAPPAPMAQMHRQQPQNYPSYHMPVDPQLMNGMHWETPAHYQAPEHEQMQLDGNGNGNGNGHGVAQAVGGAGQEEEEAENEQFERELAAQIMGENKAYGRQLRERGR